MSNLNDLKYSDLDIDGWRRVENTVTYSNAAGSGAIGTVDVFTVTGDVRMKIVAVGTVNMAGATATIELGTATNTAGLIAQTTATDIDAGDIWHDASPDADVEAATVAPEYIVANGPTIINTVGTANLTAGAIRYICLWRKVSENGNVVAA